jgi:hypothetical protein
MNEEIEQNIIITDLRCKIGFYSLNDNKNRCYFTVDINDLIKKLNEFKNKGATDIEFNIDGCYDCYVEDILIIPQHIRQETKEEALKRVESERIILDEKDKLEKTKELEEKRKQYEELKKLFENE